MFALDPNKYDEEIPLLPRYLVQPVPLLGRYHRRVVCLPCGAYPYLNIDVFKHKAITWEWAPAVLCVVVFVSGVENWKAIKRRTGWFAEEETKGMKKSRPSSTSLRQEFFSFARTLTRTRTEDERESKKGSATDTGRGSIEHVLPKVREEV